jgi:hypothetical protein
MGEVSFGLQITLTDRARSYLAKMKNILLVDTQSIRAKLLNQLQGIFDMAVSIAKGKVKQLRDEEGKEYDVMNSES